MRHGDKIKNLSRTKSHRDALLANLASQLIVHKRIVTTLAKAKALRVYIEPLITKTKKAENELQIMHQHRVVFSYLHDKAAVKELFTVVGPKISGRPGGYTRVLKLGIRPGDNAEKAMIELVDFNTIYGKGIDKITEPAKKTRRGRGSGAKKTDEVKAEEQNTTSLPEEKEPEIKESETPPDVEENKIEPPVEESSTETEAVPADKPVK